MVEIHPTAIVSPKAKLGTDIKIGAFSIVHDDVEIGDGCTIGPHAVLYDGARLGNRVKIYQGVSVANVPQDLKFGDEKTYFYVGDETQVREFVTLHRGTHATGKSTVGKNCLLMAYCHVAHDCTLGDNIILANSVHIAGHVEIGDYVIVGGVTGIHQFTKIGAYAMLGSNSKITSDVPPYIMTQGEPSRFVGLNKVGLRRRGFTTEQMDDIKETYRLLYLAGLNYTNAKEKIKTELGHKEIVKGILDFIEKSSRGIVRR